MVLEGKKGRRKSYDSYKLPVSIKEDCGYELALYNERKTLISKDLNFTRKPAFHLRYVIQKFCLI